MTPEDPEIRKDRIIRLARERLARGRLNTDLLPRQSPDAPPLSFGQERLWFLEQYDPDSHA